MGVVEGEYFLSLRTSYSTSEPRQVKSDLLEVMPELSRAVNGVLWMFAETPVLILEEGKHPDDSWDGGDVLVISMYVVVHFLLTSSA